jgi:hypothetical protein
MDHGSWTGVRVKERRRGPDGWIRVLQGLVIPCWGGFVALLSSITSPGHRGLRLSGLWGRQGAPELGPLLTLAGARSGCCLLTLVVLVPPVAAAVGRKMPATSISSILLLILVACLLLYYWG